MFRSRVNHLFYYQKSIVVSKTEQEKLLWAAVATFALLSIIHLLLGSNPIVVVIAFLIMMIGIVPVKIAGIRSIGALFVLLVAFRYVDFAVFAKFLMLQPLDSNLRQPIESFFAVLLGLTGYLIAFYISSLIYVGRPLLNPVLMERKLLIISILAALIGGAAWFGKIAAVNSLSAGADLSQKTTVHTFFTSFYLLAIISATAQTLIASNGRRSINAWCAVLLFTQLIFGVVANVRMPILNGILAYIVTVIAFRGRVRWRYIILAGILLSCIISFITPIMLYVRSFRGELSARERVISTAEISKLALSNPQVLRTLRGRIKDFQSILNYYGEPMNVFERASHIENVDVVIDGIDRSGHKGFVSIKIGLGRVLPRFINPNKDVGWSIGDKLYYEIGYRTILGGYLTLPLIADGYASFGWFGAFFFPIVFATPILIILRKFSWSLPHNIWAIYLFIRFHNSFVEGDTAAYLLGLLRIVPQDLLLLMIINYIASFPKLANTRRKPRAPL